MTPKPPIDSSENANADTGCLVTRVSPLDVIYIGENVSVSAIQKDRSVQLKITAPKSIIIERVKGDVSDAN